MTASGARRVKVSKRVRIRNRCPSLVSLGDEVHRPAVVGSQHGYRLEKDFARRGFTVARSTMNDLLHRTSELTQPLWQRLVEQIRTRPIVGADETRLLMQNEPGSQRTASSGPSSRPTSTANTM